MTVQIRSAGNSFAYATASANGGSSTATASAGGTAVARAQAGYPARSGFDAGRPLPQPAPAPAPAPQAPPKKKKGFFQKLGDGLKSIAGKVLGVASRGIDVVKGGIDAAKRGDYGGVVQAIGRGLGVVSGLFGGGAGDALKQVGGKVEQAGTVVGAGQQAVEAAKGGDWGQAVKSGLDAFGKLLGLFG